MAIRLPPKLVANVLYALYRPWFALLRINYVNSPPPDTFVSPGKPLVFAGWHNECFTLMALKGTMSVMTIASQSRDGAYIAGILEHLGFAVARGSSSRGGASALKASVRLIEQGFSPAITIDGPRGPRHKAKDGIFFLAHQAGIPILPIRAFPEWCIRFNSWDRFELPLPFSRVHIVVGEPYYVECETLDAPTLEKERAKLEGIMNNLETVQASK